MIETTAEHPFFVLDRGWVAAVELQPGDRVMGLDHDWINVDAVTTTEHLSKVYNLRVEQDHTYFVGGVDWGFAVWVHNEYKYRQISDELIEVYDDAREAGDQVVGTITKRPKPGAPGQHEYHYKSNHNQDANGNFYTEVFDTPEAAVKKFNEQKIAGEKAATAGLGETQKVDGQGKGYVLDDKGRLTNGDYVVHSELMDKHKTGSFNETGPGRPAGKSQWLSTVDAEKAVLDSAKKADEHKLWVLQPDGTWKAKVPANQIVGSLGRDGTQTNYINVTRKWIEREGDKVVNKWYIHGNPGTARD